MRCLAVNRTLKAASRISACTISQGKGLRLAGGATGPAEVIKSVLDTQRTGAKEEIFVDIGAGCMVCGATCAAEACSGHSFVATLL